MVNEKYLCYKKKQGYSTKCVKFRTLETPSSEDIIEDETIPEVTPEPQEEVIVEQDVPQEFATAAEIGEPRPEDAPLKSQAYMIKDMLEAEGKKVTKYSMRVKVVQVAKENNLPDENKRALLEYIAKHCPEELEA